MKLKVAIQTLDDKQGYIVTCEDGIEFIVRDIDEAIKLKEELHAKLDEFNNDSDTLEEVFENREQIEISMHYERIPKPTLIATEEFLDDKIHFRNPEKEKRLAEGN